jgi:hypothetical protein
MPKFIVDLWLDGYNDDDSELEACKAFLEDQLDFSASSVTIEEISQDDYISFKRYKNSSFNLLDGVNINTSSIDSNIKFKLS